MARCFAVTAFSVTLESFLTASDAFCDADSYTMSLSIELRGSLV
jgi:hypothetical protein